MGEIRDELHRTFEDQEARIATLEARCEEYREAIEFALEAYSISTYASFSRAEKRLRAALSKEERMNGSTIVTVVD
jgi:hypothetical protein